MTHRKPPPQPDPLPPGRRYEATAAETFVVAGGEVYSTVAQRRRGPADGPDRQAWPGVGLDLVGRWAAGGARDAIRLIIPSDTAEELGDLREPAAAARNDLRDHLAGVPWEQIHARGQARYRTHLTLEIPPETFAKLAGDEAGDQAAAALQLLEAAIELADASPMDPEMGDCTLCGSDWSGPRRRDHEPTCPWQRAHDATRRPE